MSTQNIKGEPGFDGSLVPGIVYGLRAFGVTEDGWLTGVTFHTPWTSGVNHAQCLRGVPPQTYGARTPLRSISASHFYISPYAFGGYMPTSHIEGTPEPVNLVDNPGHTLKGCGCGWWSFWGLGNNYGEGYEKRLTGVIAGWGRVYAGQRGFRCTKARVMALAIPDHRSDSEFEQIRDLRDAFDKVRERYHVPTFSTVDALTANYPPDDYASVRLTRRVEGEAA